MALTATTELEAVNSVLYALNEAPVTALGSNASTLGNRVEAMLDQVNREVQMEGWNFNLNFPVTLSESGGEIAVPADSLWIKVPFGQAGTAIVTPTVMGQEHIVERNRRLYKRAEGTFTFPSGSQVTNVTTCVGLEFTELPEVAREYIYLRTLRKVAAAVKPNQTRDANFRVDEIRAHGALLEQESQQDELTIFDNYDTFQAIDRKNPALYGPGWR